LLRSGERQGKRDTKGRSCLGRGAGGNGGK